MKTALVCGAGGFIGGHLVKRSEARRLLGARRRPEISTSMPRPQPTTSSLATCATLRSAGPSIDRRFDEVYQLAADMGGAGLYLHRRARRRRHAQFRDNQSEHARCLPQDTSRRRMFYSSSACIYPAYNQEDPNNPKCAEDYRLSGGARQRIWLGEAVQRAPLSRLSSQPRHVRRTWRATTTSSGPREPGPAARKRRRRRSAARSHWPSRATTSRSGATASRPARSSTSTNAWKVTRLIRSDFVGPVNIGSEEMVTINQLVDMVADIAGKPVRKRHIDGPTGVRGRNSDNRLILEKLDWAPSRSLYEGLEKTYSWIQKQVRG